MSGERVKRIEGRYEARNTKQIQMTKTENSKQLWAAVGKKGKAEGGELGMRGEGRWGRREIEYQDVKGKNTDQKSKIGI